MKQLISKKIFNNINMTRRKSRISRRSRIKRTKRVLKKMKRTKRVVRRSKSKNNTRKNNKKRKHTRKNKRNNHKKLKEIKHKLIGGAYQIICSDVKCDKEQHVPIFAQLETELKRPEVETGLEAEEEAERQKAEAEAKSATTEDVDHRDESVLGVEPTKEQEEKAAQFLKKVKDDSVKKITELFNIEGDPEVSKVFPPEYSLITYIKDNVIDKSRKRVLLRIIYNSGSDDATVIQLYNTLSSETPQNQFSFLEYIKTEWNPIFIYKENKIEIEINNINELLKSSKLTEYSAKITECGITLENIYDVTNDDLREDPINMEKEMHRKRFLRFVGKLVPKNSRAKELERVSAEKEDAAAPVDAENKLDDLEDLFDELPQELFTDRESGLHQESAPAGYVYIKDKNFYTHFLNELKNKIRQKADHAGNLEGRTSIHEIISEIDKSVKDKFHNLFIFLSQYEDGVYNLTDLLVGLIDDLIQKYSKIIKKDREKQKHSDQYHKIKWTVNIKSIEYSDEMNNIYTNIKEVLIRILSILRSGYRIEIDEPESVQYTEQSELKEILKSNFEDTVIRDRPFEISFDGEIKDEE